MQTKEELLHMINRKREQMLETAKENGINSELTLRCSQELDALIVKYQKEI